MFCGSRYAVAALPVYLRPLSYVTPAYWGLEAVRGVLIYHLDLRGVTDILSVLLVFAGVFIFLGILVFRKMERTTKTRGGLGAY